MLVFKFGGASINTIERIKNTADIINQYASQKKIVVVVSAIGKTTNALEKIAKAYCEGQQEEALLLFDQVKQNHLSVVKYLLLHNWQAAEKQLLDFFTEIEWMLHDKPVRHFDYYYDQIVCCGELFSSAILAHYLQQTSALVQWVDVRDIFRTDNNFRDAAIDIPFTTQKVMEQIVPHFATQNIVITQGFIGATDENESTTLGREGSDYSAAIFANILNATELTIWKDVPAVMSADPNKFTEAVNIPFLNYTEVIEMAYYGAQVIHPKTIKPLQNKNIPLYVKSFLDTDLPGTVINNNKVNNLPPIIVLKNTQVLIHFKSKDFSFMEGRALGQLHKIFNAVKLQPNLTQNTAVSFICCFDGHSEKTSLIAEQASLLFDVIVERDLSLLTIRHYNIVTIEQFTTSKQIILLQKTIETVQMVMRD